MTNRARGENTTAATKYVYRMWIKFESQQSKRIMLYSENVLCKDGNATQEWNSNVGRKYFQIVAR